MLAHILVPLDGTPRSEAVLPHLRRLARGRAREITLLRADLPVAMDAYSLLCEAALAQARDYLSGVKAGLADLRIPCRILARIGPPAETILQVARERGATLILVSTHPKSRITRWLFGSVSEHVLEVSPVPVIAVPQDWSYELAPEEPPESRRVRKILVPLGRDEPSFRILPRAIEMAQKFEARLHLFHVRPPGEAGGPGAPRRESAEEDSGESIEHRLKEAWLQCAGAGVETHRRIVSGEVVPWILKAAREEEMDWIAMAIHARSGLARWMTGNIPERVLRDAGLPMLIVNTASDLRSRPLGRMSLSGHG